MKKFIKYCCQIYKLNIAAILNNFYVSKRMQIQVLANHTHLKCLCTNYIKPLIEYQCVNGKQYFLLAPYNIVDVQF